MAKIITGLDIGSQSIKLVQIKRARGNQFTVTSYGTMEILPGSGSDSITPVADAIQKLVTQLKIHPVNLITAIPKQFVVVRYITLPTNSVEEVRQMIRFEAAKYVPFLAEEDIVDFELIGSSPLGGSEVLLVVSKRTAVEDHLKLLRGLHWEPYSADVSSLALTRALRETNGKFIKEPDKNHLVIELGYSMMEISLVQNRYLRYTRSAAVAGQQLSTLIQDNLGIEQKETDELITKLDLSKPNFGIDKYDGKKVQDSVNAWMERLGNEIKRSIDYFSSEFGISQIQSLLLSGGLAQMSHFKEYLERDIGIPVTLANLLPVVREDLKSQLLPHYNTALGLALRKLDAEPGTAINLLPPEILNKRVRYKQQKFVVQIAIAVLAVVIAGIIFIYQKYTTMEVDLNKINKELIQKQPRAEKLSEMKKQIDSIKKIISQTDAGVETIVALSQLESIPGRVALERFIYDRNKAITIHAAAMSMEDAVNFRFAVERTGYFDQAVIQNANPEMMEGKQVIRFQLVAKLKQDLIGKESTGSSEEM